MPLHSTYCLLWFNGDAILCADAHLLPPALVILGIAAIVIAIITNAIADARKKRSATSDFEPLKMSPAELLGVLQSTRPDLCERERAAWAGKAGKSILNEQANKVRARGTIH